MISKCIIAAELSESSVLKAVIIAKTLLAILGLVAVTVFLKTKGISWLGHPHTKCMFSIHVASTYLSTVFYLICFVTDLWRFSFSHKDRCGYVLPFRFAFPVRLIAVIGTFGQLLSITAIAMERLYASIRPASYERLNSPLIKGVSSVIVIGLSIGLNVGLCVPGVRWDEPASSFTIRTPENRERFQMLVNVEVAIELAALLTFHFCLWLNFRKKISRTNYVAGRYQVSWNKRLIIQLLPVFWTHFFCIIITSFGLVMYPYVASNIFTKDTPTNHGIFLEFVAIAPLYAVIMPVLVAYRNPQSARFTATMGENARLNGAPRGSRTPEDDKNDADEHFKALHELFASPPTKRNSAVRAVVREAEQGFGAMCCFSVEE